MFWDYSMVITIRRLLKQKEVDEAEKRVREIVLSQNFPIREKVLFDLIFKNEFVQELPGGWGEQILTDVLSKLLAEKIIIEKTGLKPCKKMYEKTA